MAVTPDFNLPYPEPNSTADVPRDFKALAEAVEAAMHALGVDVLDVFDSTDKTLPPSADALRRGLETKQNTVRLADNYLAASVLVNAAPDAQGRSYPDGLSFFKVSSSAGAWPTSNGYVVTMRAGSGGFQMYFEMYTGTTQTDKTSRFWYRSKRDSNTFWQDWSRALTEVDSTSFATRKTLDMPPADLNNMKTPGRYNAVWTSRQLNEPVTEEGSRRVELIIEEPPIASGATFPNIIQKIFYLDGTGKGREYYRILRGDGVFLSWERVDDKVVDTRTVNAAPNTYPQGITREFKQGSTLGMADTEGYLYLETRRPWIDDSAGATFQTAYGLTTGRVYTRTSTGATTWGKFRKEEQGLREPNLIPNPSGTMGLTGWTANGFQAVPNDPTYGGYFFYSAATASQYFVCDSDPITVIPGARFTVGATLTGDNGGAGANSYGVEVSGGGAILANLINKASSSRESSTFTVPAGVNSVVVRLLVYLNKPAAFRAITQVSLVRGDFDIFNNDADSRLLFQSVVNGKASLEPPINAKGGVVSKAGSVATFAELAAGINSIVVGYKATPGEVLLYNLGYSGNNNNPAYTRQFFARTNIPGTFRLRYTAVNSGSGLGYARVYKNGVPYGAERTLSPGNPTSTSYVEDLYFSAGDTIEFWTRAQTTNSNIMRLDNVQILGASVIFTNV